MNYFWWISSTFAVLIIVYITIRICRTIAMKLHLKKISKNFQASTSDMVVILNDMFHILKIENFNPSIFPYLEKTLLDVNPWALLSPEVATKVYKAYKEALTKKITVYAEINFEPYEKKKDIKIKFVIIEDEYIACFISEKED